MIGQQWRATSTGNVFEVASVIDDPDEQYPIRMQMVEMSERTKAELHAHWEQMTETERAKFSGGESAFVRMVERRPMDIEENWFLNGAGKRVK